MRAARRARWSSVMASSSRGDPQGKVRRRVPTHQGPAVEEASGLFRHRGLIHGVEPYRLGGLAAWPFGDFIFHVQADAFFDGNKARRFGFHEMHLDSAEEIVRLMQFRAETVADTAPRLPVLRAC